jgi:predicted MFS family arabinose efflux permease
MTVPAWQAIVTYLVPKNDLPPAIAANSIGVNISRALGPALGGMTISAYGVVAPFWINAVSNLAIVGSLLWWRPAPRTGTLLPAERLGQAILAGLRYARHNRHLRATLIRAAGFFLFASAYWALLPLVSREQIGGGPGLYGVLLGVIGASAVGGAFLLPFLKEKLGPDRLMALGALGQAIAMMLYGIAREPVTALVASATAGASWIVALATLSVSAQVALPDWVRARTGALHNCIFRLSDAGQRGLGRGRRCGWPGECALSRERRRRRRDCTDLAVVTANRRDRRFVAFDALAGATDRAADRARSRPRPGHCRISHRPARPRSVSRSARGC